MARKNIATVYLEFSLAKLFSFLIKLLPWSLTLRLGQLLGWLVGKFFIKRNKIARQNLSLVFPEKAEREKSAIIGKVWQNLGQMLVESLKIPQFKKKHFARWTTLIGRENVDRALAGGKGVIFLVAHFGNWEMGGAVVSHSGYPLAVIARPLDNELLNGEVNRIRSCHGATILSSRNAVKESLRWLRNNGVLAILIDQNFYQGGIFVDFFGRPAATTNIVPLLAAKTGAKILPIFCRRENGKTVIAIEKEVEINNLDSVAATAKLTGIIETWIRRYPKEWFWIHDRWKRKP
ncbi:MAG: lysophospholipid acyltransferase family protein [Elusimicrobiota bacterium]